MGRYVLKKDNFKSCNQSVALKHAIIGKLVTWKTPEFQEMQTSTDVPILLHSITITELLSITLFVCTGDQRSRAARMSRFWRTGLGIWRTHFR